MIKKLIDLFCDIVAWLLVIPVFMTVAVIGVVYVIFFTLFHPDGYIGSRVDNKIDIIRRKLR